MYDLLKLSARPRRHTDVRLIDVEIRRSQAPMPAGRAFGTFSGAGEEMGARVCKSNTES
ncbi:hypothetical protein FOMPIDRAFT_1026312 [Fomitopsis schrenkii]|uniref:Uncharacterized protein n=1 Tax=Fomitopsis schrenkii TaxID=2126942 RepID=S8DSF8_FOMSC|nr:hypothetical protein FOMPIDRAFT_1026312 [Fomitopsis schrenkii]